jgi:hypothetical protein
LIYIWMCQCECHLSALPWISEGEKFQREDIGRSDFRHGRAASGRLQRGCIILAGTGTTAWTKIRKFVLGRSIRMIGKSLSVQLTVVGVHGTRCEADTLHLQIGQLDPWFPLSRFSPEKASQLAIKLYPCGLRASLSLVSCAARGASGLLTSGFGNRQKVRQFLILRYHIVQL